MDSNILESEDIEVSENCSIIIEDRRKEPAPKEQLDIPIQLQKLCDTSTLVTSDDVLLIIDRKVGNELSTSLEATKTASVTFEETIYLTCRVNNDTDTLD